MTVSSFEFRVSSCLIALLAFCASALGQSGVRVPAGGGQLTTTAVINGTTVIVPKAATTIQFCNRPANAVPCSNKATTYTDATLGTPCSTSTQVVLDGTTSCIAGSDSLGNWGVWVASGNYEWTFTDSGGNSFGPYFVTANSAPNTNAWSSLTNPSSNLTLAMGSNTTAFNYPANPTAGTMLSRWGTSPDSIDIVGSANSVLSLVFGGNIGGSSFGHGGFIGMAGANGVGISNFQIVTNDTLGNLVKVSTTQTSGVAFGICQYNCTTTNAAVAFAGIAFCAFDGAVTYNDWVTVSSTVAGDCHDAGATPPATSVTTIGRVLQTSGSAGNFKVWLQISR